MIINIKRIDERENKVHLESGSPHLDHIPVVYQHDQDRHDRSNKLENVGNNTPHKINNDHKQLEHETNGSNHRIVHSTDSDSVGGVFNTRDSVENINTVSNDNKKELDDIRNNIQLRS